LIPAGFAERVISGKTLCEESNVASSDVDRLQRRGDLAWSIAVGGIGIVAFAAALLFAWVFAATLFLIFAGILLGVFLNAITELFGRVVTLGHALRLVVVCAMLAAMSCGVLVLGGSTIAQQAAPLSATIKSQIGHAKSFLDQHGVDTGFLDIGSLGPNPAESPAAVGGHSPASGLPSAGALASGGSAIVSQTLRLILGTIGAVGNFFVVLFLGLCFAAQPGIYRLGLLRLVPSRHRLTATEIAGNIGTLLQRWLLAQAITMAVVFAVTWIGLLLIGVPGAFILGVQAGLLAFIPTVGALLGGLIIVLASLASGWVTAASAFALFLGVHALESYILTPLIQRQAIDIPPATLFATQILLGTVFGLWGLALALPLMAVVKVAIDHFRDADAPAVIGAT
jgi:predicted PurR-regulated permease PerM